MINRTTFFGALLGGFLAVIVTIVLPVLLMGQSSPNWSQGFVPTAAQWNAAFAIKQDYLGSPPLLTGAPDQLITGGANVTPFGNGSTSTFASNIFNVDCGKSPLQTVTNDHAFTFTAPTGDGSCIVRVVNATGVGATSYSGFTNGANTGDTIDQTVGHAFAYSVWCISTVCRYLISAYQ